jgi:hypothetical protein
METDMKKRTTAAPKIAAGSPNPPGVGDLDPDVVTMAQLAAALIDPTGKTSGNVVDAVERAIKLYEEAAAQIADWPPALGSVTPQQQRHARFNSPRG